MANLLNPEAASGSVGKSQRTRRFSMSSTSNVKRRMSTIIDTEGVFGPPRSTLFLGVSAVFADDHTAVIAIAIRDATYLIDFSVKSVVLDDADAVSGADLIASHIIEELKAYEEENFAKFIGAGLPTMLRYMSPTLCSRMWLELDIVPIVMRPDQEKGMDMNNFWDIKRVDEQADSMARKCLMNFGPSLVPLLQVGFRGVVQTDAGFRAQLLTLQNFRDTCDAPTWNAMKKYADLLRQRKIKIATFSATPQGGGVALMRHALVRFARLLGVDLTWYVPKPRPGVFRVTKNIHNILQGVSAPEQRISEEEKQSILDWITENANRYWLSEGGPLRPVSEGGADVVIIDDPQMPGLIPMIKKLTPDRPVLYRSHIQVRSDLIAKEGSPQADIWQFLWSTIQGCDAFISHPIPAFVPHTVPRHKITYFPATTDWLDGLNKPLSEWDTHYYGHLFNEACHSQRMPELGFPARKYIVQVARFDPSKGIPTVIDAYAEFRRRWDERLKTSGSTNVNDIPQLLICGNGSVDDPDAVIVYDQTITQLETHYPQLMGDVCVMRLDPNDQLLNTLIANAYVALQLSTREGFEVKVSEALHAGVPVIGTRGGGIPLQIKDNETGFLVEPGDYKTVANHLMDLFSDPSLRRKMSVAAANGVSDELGTVGNALGWFYLAVKWVEAMGGKGSERAAAAAAAPAATGGKPAKSALKSSPAKISDSDLPHGNERWLNDMAREDAEIPYKEGENRLPRHYTQVKQLPVGQGKE